MKKHYQPTPVFDTLYEKIGFYKSIYDSNNPRHQIKKWLEHCFLKLKIDIPASAIVNSATNPRKHREEFLSAQKAA